MASECTWATVVLITNGGGDYYGICLMEVLWKVIIIIIIDWRLAESIKFHDVMHRFRAQRGTGMATLEAKILQNIAGMRQEYL